MIKGIRYLALLLPLRVLAGESVTVFFEDFGDALGMNVIQHFSVSGTGDCIAQAFEGHEYAAVCVGEGGPGGPSEDSILTTNSAVDLSAMVCGEFRFSLHLDLLDLSEFVDVQFSPDGVSWDTLARFQPTEGQGWRDYVIDLNPIDHGTSDALFRFFSIMRQGLPDDGAGIDTVQVVLHSECPLYADGFERIPVN